MHEGSQQPARTCDGSGRRQIPMPFFGAGKRACAAVCNKQESSQVTALSSVIMPAAPKNGKKRDLTKGSVSRFLVTLF